MKDLCTKEYSEHNLKSNNVLACVGISIILYLLVIFSFLILLFREFRGAYEAAQGDYDQLVENMLIINQTSNMYVYASFGSQLLALVICVIWFYYRHIKKEPVEFSLGYVKSRLANPKLIIFLLFCAVACFSLSNVLQNFASAVFPDKFKEITNELKFWESSKFLYFLLSIVIIPLYLEIGYRGLILKRSQKAWGLIGCIIINTLLNASYFRNPISFICVIPLGIITTYMAFMFNSVIPGVMLHMGVNLLDFILWVTFSDGITPEILFVLFILFIIFGISAFLIGKDLFEKPIGSGYFNVRLEAVPVPKTRERSIPPKVLWKVSLVHKKQVGSVARNVSFSEKYFESANEAEKWLFEKGFVFGKNTVHSKSTNPSWFHKNDTKSDYVIADMSEITVDSSHREAIWDDKWVDELNGRKRD